MGGKVYRRTSDVVAALKTGSGVPLRSRIPGEGRTVPFEGLTCLKSPTYTGHDYIADGIHGSARRGSAYDF